MSASRKVFHQPRPDSGFMSRRQVAEEFGFSIGFLNTLPKSELPFHKRGGKIFYERETVVAWIRGETSPPPAPPSVSTGKRGRRPHPVIQRGIAAASAR
jgi:hypothetical protein